MEKEVSIIWQGKPEIVVLQEITWKQKKNAMRKAVKEVQKGRKLEKEVDPILQRELMMLASIKTAPFPLMVESFDELSGKDGEKLYKAYVALNELNETDEEGEQ